MTMEAGLVAYEDCADMPALVVEAVELSRRHGCDQACLPEVGRLLQLLASHEQGGRVGEIGTAFAVGAAWLASGLRADGRLVTVELDPIRAAGAWQLFEGRDEVLALPGDWRLIGQYAPFDVLFADGGPKHEPEAPDVLAPLLRLGGLLVLDDFTPESAWTPEMRARWGSAAGDPTRQLWLNHPKWRAQELQLGATASVILAVRIG